MITNSDFLDTIVMYLLEMKVSDDDGKIRLQ
jgi:hypothetical protein